MFTPLSSIQPNRKNSWTAPQETAPTINKQLRTIAFKENVTTGREQQCKPGFGLSLAEGVNSIMTPASELAHNVLDYFTGIPNWGKSLKSDICDGKIGSQAATSTAKMIGRTLGTALGARAAFWIGAASIASGSVPFLIGGGALAGAVLLVAPTAGEKIVQTSGDLWDALVKSA